VKIYELRLGYDHPETADAYSKLALANQESGKTVQAVPWMRRAFCGFFHSFGPHDSITQSTYTELMTLEMAIDSDL
jgi:hypothetical protein